jgi:hypothetical protein
MALLSVKQEVHNPSLLSVTQKVCDPSLLSVHAPALIQIIHTGTLTYNNGRKKKLPAYIRKNKSARAACMHGAGIHRNIDSGKPAHIPAGCASEAGVQVAAGGLCHESWWLYLLTLATREKRKGEESYTLSQRRT